MFQQAIDPVGATDQGRPNSIFYQVLAEKELLTVCSNKYVKSNVKHPKHLPELLEIMGLLFRGLCIMEYPSRPNKGTFLSPAPTTKADNMLSQARGDVELGIWLEP